MSIRIQAFTATPRPRSESASGQFGAGHRTGTRAFQAPGTTARWPHGTGISMLGRPAADIQLNPNRDRVAAKPGSPPRGNPR